VYEWVSVCIAGGPGGVANVALDYIDSGASDHRPSARTVLVGLATIFVGGVAGFVFWGLNASGGAFDSLRADPARIAGAVIAGLGGARLLRQYATSRQVQEANQRLGGSIADLLSLYAQEAEQQPLKGGDQDADS
jgi:ethanolamine transporter EutH